MKRPFIVTTPFPTIEEVAKLGGVTRARTKELVAMAEEFLRESKSVPRKSNGRKASKRNPAKSIERKKRK